MARPEARLIQHAREHAQRLCGRLHDDKVAPRCCRDYLFALGEVVGRRFYFVLVHDASRA